MSDRPIIVWFRRALRLGDHPALDAAVASGGPIVPIYVLDDDTAAAWRLGGGWQATPCAMRGRGSRLVPRRSPAPSRVL